VFEGFGSSALIGFLATSPRRRIGVFAAVAVIGLALSACGRNGDPLPPPDANAPADAKSSDGPSGFGRPNNPPIEKPHTPFLLDPLL
jgi:predicted small lipoprotein YifL